MKKKTRRLLLTPVLILVGAVPSLAFFIWIERNMALPWVGTWIGWPWIRVEGGLAASILFDLILIAGFGFLHSALIGRTFKSTYLIVTGISVFVIMAGWQSTGIVLYQLIPSATLSSALSIVLYWGLIIFAHRARDFLSTYFRHPLYTFSFAAWILTPMMSLDRLVLIFGMALYLAIGIRREVARERA